MPRRRDTQTTEEVAAAYGAEAPCSACRGPAGGGAVGACGDLCVFRARAAEGFVANTAPWAGSASA
jgi:hypothetical protein